MRFVITRRHLLQRSLLLFSLAPLLMTLMLGAPKPVTLGCFALFIVGFAAKFVVDYRWFRSRR